MAIEHYLKIDTVATPGEVKAAILGAVLFDDKPDWKHHKHLGSAATGVTIRDRHDPGATVPVSPASEPKNGVTGRISVSFRSRDYEKLPQFDTETVGSIVAVLKAFPDANLYLKAYVDIPALIRKDRRLVLAAALTHDDRMWSDTWPYRRMFDMPYTIEPLGPW